MNCFVVKFGFSGAKVYLNQTRNKYITTQKPHFRTFGNVYAPVLMEKRHLTIHIVLLKKQEKPDFIL